MDLPHSPACGSLLATELIAGSHHRLSKPEKAAMPAAMGLEKTSGIITARIAGCPAFAIQSRPAD
jgi:hypothetical protein